MNARDVQQKIAEALSREQPLSFAECNGLLIEVAGAMGEVGDRIARITPGGNGGRTPVGKEYQRALQTGTAEDVQKLEAEFKEASTLAAQLKAQRDALNDRRTVARTGEAKANMPSLHETLTKKLDKAEAAKAALKQALDEVNGAAGEIMQARAAIRMGTHCEPDGGATVATLQRLNALHDAFAMDNPTYRFPVVWLDRIGCAITERVYKDALVKVPDADYRDCETDAAVMRKAVETLFGPRDEDDAEIARAFGGLPARARERMAA